MISAPTKYRSGVKIEKNEMGGECSTHKSEERRIQDFGGETFSHTRKLHVQATTQLEPVVRAYHNCHHSRYIFVSLCP